MDNYNKSCWALVYLGFKDFIWGINESDGSFESILSCDLVFENLLQQEDVNK